MTKGIDDDADIIISASSDNNPAPVIDFSTNKIPNENTAKTNNLKISSLAFKAPITKCPLYYLL